MPTENLSSSRKILRQLYFLRNIIIAFILAMILLALFGLNINLPVLPLSIILLIMTVTNLFTRFIIDSSREISDSLIFIQLLLEIFSFSLILFFSGGATNPFTFFYLIPLAISAILIPGIKTWILTVLTVVMYSLLLEYYVPLIYREHHQNISSDGQFSQHVQGMWFGFLLSATLVTWFITYLSKELKQRNQAIADARQRELRDQQMITLGTLAAGTAHELGTPLASLAIIAGDITHGFDEKLHPELFENQKILRQQIQRCKKILSVLSDSAGESRAEAGGLITADAFVQRLMQHWQQQRPDTQCRVTKEALPRELKLVFDQTILQALTNLLNNAADVSSDSIELEVSASQQQISLKIIDRGQGISDEQIAMAGEVTFSNKPDGMGIGLFLAITTIRRSGGSVSFNRLKSGGTLTLVNLPIIST